MTLSPSRHRRFEGFEMSEVAELSAGTLQTNAPTIDLAAVLAPDKLAAWLDYEFSQHMTNTATLLARHDKFLAVTKDGINDDTLAGHATDFAKELKAEQKATDDTRVRVKAPVLSAQRLIDDQSKKLTSPLSTATETVEYRITTYLKAKEVTARVAAEQEATRLAIEAEARIAEAQATGTMEASESAVEAIHEAQQADRLATAAPLELTRTRSAAGALTGLKDNWQYRVIDVTKIPTTYLTVNDVMVKAAMKTAGKNIKDLKIEGLEFYNDAKAYVR